MIQTKSASPGVWGFGLLLLFLCIETKAQQTLRHNDLVGLSPNADKNVQLLDSYLDDLMLGNFNRAESYLSPDYAEFGPGAGESMNVQQLTESWERAAHNRTEQNISNRSTISLKAKAGPEPGDWVMSRGIYNWRERKGGPLMSVPFQVTALVDKGKLKNAYLYYDRPSAQDRLGYSVLPSDQDPELYLIKKVIEDETNAWLQNDGKQMQSCWADLSYAAHTLTDDSGKAYVVTASEMSDMLLRLSTQKPNEAGMSFSNTRYDIRPNGNAAWVTFEQTFLRPNGDRYTNLESRYLEKIGGNWKIVHMTTLPKK
ncbi:nuclear transport factor 2 family protein [Telluribacter sp.]|jgi:hypothetical protein|uniref:nuclear transport factor 2 family protein n=1 Tax=Telluribacter sp. TaxID=1978767 RepID=UPI002E0D6F1D|nr:nuclear transport factor 2 family protein [Telluribacter sp.]